MLYSEEFFGETPEQEWLKSLKTVSERLGRLENHEILSWNVSRRVQSSGSGTLVKFSYKVKYSKFDAEETIILFKPRRTDRYLIVRHHIDSKGFQYKR